MPVPANKWSFFENSTTLNAPYIHLRHDLNLELRQTFRNDQPVYLAGLGHQGSQWSNVSSVRKTKTLIRLWGSADCLYSLPYSHLFPNAGERLNCYASRG